MCGLVVGVLGMVVWRLTIDTSILAQAVGAWHYWIRLGWVEWDWTGLGWIGLG